MSISMVFPVMGLTMKLGSGECLVSAVNAILYIITVVCMVALAVSPVPYTLHIVSHINLAIKSIECHTSMEENCDTVIQNDY